MKLKVAALAAAALLAATPSFATTGSFFDPGSSTFFFGSLNINSNTSFDDVFTLVAGAGLPTGVYTFEGDISGSKLTFDSVTLDGTPFDLTTNHRAGTIDLTDALPVIIEVIGKAGSFTTGKANYQGSLALTAAPVPEPETYALMLAGLGAVGFAARRRKAD